MKASDLIQEKVEETLDKEQLEDGNETPGTYRDCIVAIKMKATDITGSKFGVKASNSNSWDVGSVSKIALPTSP